MNDMLLHICCAPCSVYPLKILAALSGRIAGFFYNPNIHPSQEYMKRRDAVRGLASSASVEVSFGTYDMEAFLAAVPQGPERCRACYGMRLDGAAAEARRRGMPAFTTTLLYSRRQKHDLVREAGAAAASRHGVSFDYRDFRDGWEEGIRESKALGLYRQNYCGCVYSEKERFFR